MQTVYIHGTHPRNGYLQAAEFRVLAEIEGREHIYKCPFTCRTFHELIQHALCTVLKYAVSKKLALEIRTCQQALVSRMNMSLAATAKCRLVWIPKTEMPESLVPQLVSVNHEGGHDENPA